MLIGAVFLLAASGCQAFDTRKAAKVVQRQNAQQQGTIGVATQEADGTYVLQLRTPPHSGVVGDALVRYPRDDTHYAQVARHIGSIPIGKWVPVKPFPDQ